MISYLRDVVTSNDLSNQSQRETLKLIKDFVEEDEETSYAMTDLLKDLRLENRSSTEKLADILNSVKSSIKASSEENTEESWKMFGRLDRSLKKSSAKDIVEPLANSEKQQSVVEKKISGIVGGAVTLGAQMLAGKIGGKAGLALFAGSGALGEGADALMGSIMGAIPTYLGTKLALGGKGAKVANEALDAAKNSKGIIGSIKSMKGLEILKSLKGMKGIGGIAALGAGALGLGALGMGAANNVAQPAAKVAEKTATKGLEKGALKLGGEELAKFGGKTLLKGVLKKLPVIGAVAGGIFAAQRAMEGDILGAGLEMASGIASIFPGIGTAISVGIDGLLLGKDTGLLDSIGKGLHGIPYMIAKKVPNLIGTLFKFTPLGMVAGATLDVGKALFSSGNKDAAMKNLNTTLSTISEYTKAPYEFFKKVLSFLPIAAIGGFISGILNLIGVGGGNDNSPKKKLNSIGNIDSYNLDNKQVALSKDKINLPVKGPITSKFGPRNGRIHGGTDFGVPTGTPVRSILDGTVLSSGKMGGYGNLIQVKHANGLVSRYAHLSSMRVRAGQKVKKDEIIGSSGNTGHSTGSHLHFELRKNGKAINNMKFIKDYNKNITPITRSKADTSAVASTPPPSEPVNKPVTQTITNTLPPVTPITQVKTQIASSSTAQDSKKWSTDDSTMMLHSIFGEMGVFS